jgi:hypothetical protein
LSLLSFGGGGGAGGGTVLTTRVLEGDDIVGLESDEERKTTRIREETREESFTSFEQISGTRCNGAMRKKNIKSIAYFLRNG